jgi:3-carboxy-cis,cis-muconate cycloisomerase
MSSSLIDCLATTGALAEVFSDAGVIQAMLDFEVALARASVAAGVIPSTAAEVVSAAAGRGDFDIAAIAAAARADATPAIPVVKVLRERVAEIDRASATYVHWGATSQDVTDTALILLLRRAQGIIQVDHDRLEQALRVLSDRHADTVMAGRTLLQPATPVTLGLKIAGWTAPIVRSWRRLHRAWESAMVIQLGGAAGTRAALGDQGTAIADAMARALGLRPAVPWHTDRDRLGALVAGCGLYVAALGKVARDVALLMQAEVKEAAEPGGGSSTMPQKQNPSGCAVVLAAATRLPGLVASYLTAMSQEHERGVGGIQAEWPIVSAVVQATGAAAAALAGAIDGLEVDPVRMRANLDATGGTVHAERAMLVLARALGRDRAQQLVADALAESRAGGVSFASALRSAAEGERGLASGMLDDLDRPEQYLGSAEAIRTQRLGETDDH